VAWSGYHHFFLEVQGEPHIRSARIPNISASHLQDTSLKELSLYKPIHSLLSHALNFCFKSYKNAYIKSCGLHVVLHLLDNQHEVYFLMQFIENKCISWNSNTNFSAW
jgi:hypothetical protein